MRGPRRLWKQVAGVVGGLALLATGCQSQGGPAPTAHPASTFQTVLYVPDTINPLQTKSVWGADVDDLMFDSLVTVRPDLTFGPDLAERWQASADGKVWTFWLNPKARWWDGHPVTARDVVFTYQLESNPQSGFPWAANDRATIASVVAKGNYQVEFTLTHPDGAFLANFAAQNSGNWILPAYLLEKLPVDQVAKSPYLNNPADMVGTGPFQPVNYHPNQSILLRANPHYFLGAPKLARLSIQFVAQSDTIAAELVRHSLDLVPQVPQSAEKALLQDSATTSAYRFARGIRLSYRYVMFNFQRVPALANRWLRTGLIQAVDRQAIVDQVLGHDGVVANGPIPPVSWAYNPAPASGWAYSPAAARQDLARAGYHWNAQGQAVDSSNRPLRLQLVIESNRAAYQNIAAVIQQDLGAIGVGVEIRALPPPAFVQALEAGDFDLALVGWTLTADPDQGPLFASNQVPPAGENFGHYHSPTVDRLLQAEETSASQSERRQIFFELQAAMAEDPPGIFLYFPDDYYAVKKTVQGYQFNPDMDFYQPWKWTLTAPR